MVCAVDGAKRAKQSSSQSGIWCVSRSLFLVNKPGPGSIYVCCIAGRKLGHSWPESSMLFKIDVLQAEVTALKSLVLTSTPAAPNRHLHPQVRRDVIPPLILQLQINAPNGHHAEDAKKKSVFSRGHRRSTSHHQFSQGGAAEAMATAPPPAEPPEVIK